MLVSLLLMVFYKKDMLGTNIKNHSGKEKRPMNILGRQAFMTRVEVEVRLKKEKEKASTSTFNLVMKHPYSLQVAVNLILLDMLFRNS